MNSNLDDYLETVIKNVERGLSIGEITMDSSLPCSIFRELEVPNNRFVVSSDPFMSSYRALSKIQHVIKPAIPRKIQFESAVYLKEGVIDFIFPNMPATLIFVGDGNSDKRFSYNCYRLFKTFGDRFKNYCYICNDGLDGKKFGNSPVSMGWNETDLGEKVFYHASDWDQLNVFEDLMQQELNSGRRVLVLVDFDGTYLCPRPNENRKIKNARKQALVDFCAKQFDSNLFKKTDEQVEKLHKSYVSAENTVFSKNYDDEDLTMLIALALFFEIISENDPLLVGQNNVGFNLPIEFLTYAIFLIDNHEKWEYDLRQLKALYVRCSNAINDGSPTAFVEFRQFEERILTNGAKVGGVILNKRVAEFILNSAKLHAVPIGYSDRPNASVGLRSNSDAACTATAFEGSLMNTPIKLG